MTFYTKIQINKKNLLSSELKTKILLSYIDRFYRIKIIYFKTFNKITTTKYKHYRVKKKLQNYYPSSMKI